MDDGLYFCFVGLALGVGFGFAVLLIELEQIKDLIKKIKYAEREKDDDDV